MRSNSGGAGLHPGGDGVIREIEFLRPLSVGILSERRVLRPYGMAGGEPGATGENYILVRERPRVEANLPDGEAAMEVDDEEEKAEAKPQKKKGRPTKKQAAPAGAAAAASSSASASSAAGSSSSSGEWVTRRVNLGGKNTYLANAHDRIQIITPGGGGWGAPKGAHTNETVAATAATAPMDTTTTAASSSSTVIVTGKRKLSADGAESEQQVVKKVTTTFVAVTELRTQGSVAAWTSMGEQA